MIHAPVVKGISRRPPEPEVGVRIPAGAPATLKCKGCLFFYLFHTAALAMPEKTEYDHGIGMT
jgi:hypothetical protein